MTVVYIDSVFLLNAAMDFLLLLATEDLAGVPRRRGRCLLAAIFGGAYAAVVFLPGCGGLAHLPGKLAAGLAMALIAYGGRPRFLRLSLLALAVSCALAGCVLCLGLFGGEVPMENGVFYTNVNLRVLLTAAAAAYLLMSVVFRASAARGAEGKRIPVTVCLRGKTLHLTALYDTGNALRDPLSGQPVLVISADTAQALFPPPLRITGEWLKDPASCLERLQKSGYSVRLLPYRAVGTSGGLLLAIRCDRAEIGGRIWKGLLLALSPTHLENGVSALWGGEEGEAGNGTVERLVARGAAKAWTAADAGDPLHRRK